MVKSMKKTIYSLAALMFIAAPVMTSCSNDLAEEVCNNVMTITIAPPEPESETRVGVENYSFKITGWEENDIVTLYKAKSMSLSSTDHQIIGTGKVFKCTDAENGIFTCTDWGDDNINDYNLAVFGATAEVKVLSNKTIIVLKPNFMVSTQMKDVIMMIAVRENNSYKMMFANNIVSISGYASADDLQVAWYGKETYTGSYGLFTPTVQIDLDYESDDRIAIGLPIENLKKSNNIDSFDQVKFSLPTSQNTVVYLNMCLAGGDETWFLGKKNATATSNQILSPKNLNKPTRGKLYTASYPK